MNTRFLKLSLLLLIGITILYACSSDDDASTTPDEDPQTPFQLEANYIFDPGTYTEVNGQTISAGSNEISITYQYVYTINNTGQSPQKFIMFTEDPVAPSNRNINFVRNQNVNKLVLVFGDQISLPPSPDNYTFTNDAIPNNSNLNTTFGGDFFFESVTTTGNTNANLIGNYGVFANPNSSFLTLEVQGDASDQDSIEILMNLVGQNSNGTTNYFEWEVFGTTNNWFN